LRNETLFQELTRLNPELEEWWMTADFAPLMLRDFKQFWRRRQR
jgi:hypothetical protein